ncbi:MAG: hypothetical protein ABIN01_25865, partial [Ferruginibacter sp.]
GFCCALELNGIKNKKSNSLTANKEPFISGELVVGISSRFRRSIYIMTKKYIHCNKHFELYPVCYSVSFIAKKSV